MSLFSRRRLLSGLGITALAAGGVSYFSCTVGGDQIADLSQPETLDVLLADLVDAPRIGKAARARFGLPLLHSAAAQAPQIQTALSIPCAVTRRAHLRQATRTDFATGAIVVCDRLVLSETEVIIAGLRA
jgi:hypothetical protein